ncbi:hypothetical protein EDB89DRAFT_2128340, partial [Lactarius sanguifluus]
KRDDVSDTEDTHHSKHPRIATHAEPPRAALQLARRSVPLPRKIAYKPRRAPSAPVLGITPFLVPYSPPPRRPPSPPANPDHAPPLVDPDPRPLAPIRTVVEDDNSPMRGVKTLDDSVFAPVSAQDDAVSTPYTEDSSPQTPPHAHLFPRHALERPRDPDELTTRATNKQRRGNTRAPYPATPRQHDKHANAPPTPDASRLAKKRRRATAAAPATSPLPNRITARARDRHVRAARRHADQPAPAVPSHAGRHPHHAEVAETAPTTDKPRDRANAAVENFLRQYDADQPTPRQAPTQTNPTYDAVARHHEYVLATDPDTTRVTQPFALRPRPHAVLLQWKKR